VRELENAALGVVVQAGLGRSVPGAAADLGGAVQVAVALHPDAEHLHAVGAGRLAHLVGRLLELDGGRWSRRRQRKVRGQSGGRWGEVMPRSIYLGSGKWELGMYVCHTRLDRVLVTTSRKNQDASRKTFVVLVFVLARLAIVSNTS